jgi:hypothetical protein
LDYSGSEHGNETSGSMKYGKAEFWEILIMLPSKGPMSYNKQPSALSSVLTCKFVPVNKIEVYVAKEVYIYSLLISALHRV